MTNRFAPPGAEVRDPIRQVALPPSSVRLAVGLFWASLALGVPSLIYETLRSTETVAGVVAFAVQAALFAYGAFVIVSVYRGKNWARIISLLLTLAELAILFSGAGAGEQSFIEAVCNWVAAVLDVAAMYLLFASSSSRGWFTQPHIQP